MAGSDKNNVFRYKELYEKYGELPELGDIKLGGTDEIITVKLCVPEKGVEVEKSFSIYDTVSGALDSGGGGGGNNTFPLSVECSLGISSTCLLSHVQGSVFYSCHS